jgi:hypothetical protein
MSARVVVRKVTLSMICSAPRNADSLSVPAMGSAI